VVVAILSLLPQIMISGIKLQRLPGIGNWIDANFPRFLLDGLGVNERIEHDEAQEEDGRGRPESPGPGGADGGLGRGPRGEGLGRGGPGLGRDDGEVDGEESVEQHQDAGQAGGFGVITTGLARNYFVENLDELPARPAHLHVGAYPYPSEAVRAFVAPLTRVLLLEEGYPYLERALRGIVPPARLEIQGRESGAVPPDGELNPDIVRAALGLPARAGLSIPGLSLPDRPPQLCAGCPHGDSFHAITDALAAFPDAIVTADIGCSTLAALPPRRLAPRSPAGEGHGPDRLRLRLAVRPQRLPRRLGYLALGT